VANEVAKNGGESLCVLERGMGKRARVTSGGDSSKEKKKHPPPRNLKSKEGGGERDARRQLAGEAEFGPTLPTEEWALLGKKLQEGERSEDSDIEREVRISRKPEREHVSGGLAVT